MRSQLRTLFFACSFLSCALAWFTGSRLTCQAFTKVVLKCPASFSHPKCYCKFNENNCQSSIECKSITDTTELLEAFQFDWGKTNAFDYFWLESSQLTSLPNGIFNGVSFKAFHGMFVNISNVGDKAFQGSENTATEVNVYDSNLSGFNFKSLQIFKNLTIAFIGKSHIKEVPQDAFNNLGLLETIYLRDNEISDIQPNTFNSLPNLRYLDLAGNKLTDIKNGALNLAPVKDTKGLSVDLENNQISSIGPQVFAGLSTPGYIDLQDNKLTDVPEDVFKPLLDTMVKQNANNDDVWFNVRGNPMDCSKNIDWILKNEQFRKKVGGYTCPDGSRPIHDYKEK